VYLDHGDHDLLVSWGEGGFTVDSLTPLTVVEDVVCGACGVVGRIEQGAWVPAAEGGGRGAH